MILAVVAAVDSGNGVFGEGFLGAVRLHIPRMEGEKYHERKSRVRPSSRYGCFLKWWYPQIIHLNTVFHYNHPFWGTFFLKHPYESQEPLVTFFFSPAVGLNLMSRRSHTPPWPKFWGKNLLQCEEIFVISKDKGNGR